MKIIGVGDGRFPIPNSRKETSVLDLTIPYGNFKIPNPNFKTNPKPKCPTALRALGGFGF